MTVSLYANGTGGVLGDELVTETELYTSGFVYYVHHTGSDSGSGITRQHPWASLAHAIATIANNDIVVLLDGHAETISAAQTIAQDGVKVVGEGSDGGVPTVELTSGLTNQTMLTVSGINVALGNIRFKVGGTNTTAYRIVVSGVRSMMRGCYVECGDGDPLGTINWKNTSTGARMFETSLVNVATTTQPNCALLTEGAENYEFEAVTADGGTAGFLLAGILDASAVAPTTAPGNLRCQQMRLLNGAGFLTGSTTTGYIGIAEKSGAPVVQGFHRRLANGFRQTGDAMLADVEFYMSGTPFYVHYGTGADANAGTDELAPKKTLESALSVLTNDCDIVVLLPGHVEPLLAGCATGTVGTTIVGCGTSDGKPSCKLYRDSGAAGFVLYSDAQLSYVRNIWFEKTASENTATKQVLLSTQYSEMRGCLLTPGVKDVIGLSVEASLVTVRETKFESPATSLATRPARGLSYPTSEGTLTDEDVRGCEVSNATKGFTQYGFQEDEAVTRLYVIALTQSFGADVKVNSSTTGLVNPETASGSASVEW